MGVMIHKPAVEISKYLDKNVFNGYSNYFVLLIKYNNCRVSVRETEFLVEIANSVQEHISNSSIIATCMLSAESAG